MKPHTRPALSFVCFVLAFAAAGYAIYVRATDGILVSGLLFSALALVVVAEILNYLARIAARMDQLGAEAEFAAKQRGNSEAAAKLAADAERHRAEVHEIGQSIRSS